MRSLCAHKTGRLAAGWGSSVAHRFSQVSLIRLFRLLDAMPLRQTFSHAAGIICWTLGRGRWLLRWLLRSVAVTQWYSRPCSRPSVPARGIASMASTSTTGDLNGAGARLGRELRQLKYTNAVDEVG